MFTRFWLKRRYNKILAKLRSYQVVDDILWPEYKALHIEGMILACMIDYRSSPESACLQALNAVKLHRSDYLDRVKMPSEMYADLIVTLRELVSAPS